MSCAVPVPSRPVPFPSAALARLLASVLATAMLIAPPVLAGDQETNKQPGYLEQHIRYIYVPLDQFHAVTRALPRGKFMRASQLGPLFSKAWQRIRMAGLPGGDSVILSARYRGELGERTLDLAGTVLLRKVTDGWSLVQLPLEGVALRSIKVDGDPWPALSDGDALVVPVHDAGEHVVELSGAAPLQLVQGNPTARFSLPAGAAGRLALQIPRDRRLLVDGKLLEGSVQEGKKLVELTLPNRPVHLTAVLEEQEAQRRTVLVARHRCNFLVRADGVDLEQITRLQVFAFPIQSVTFRLPRALEFTDVQAPQLTRWTIQEGEGDDLNLVLVFREPFRGARDITLRAILPRAAVEGAVELPRVLVAGAAGQTGTVIIRADQGLATEIVSLEGARYLNLAELLREQIDTLLADQTRLRALGFWTPSYAIRLQVRRVRAEILVGAASVVQIGRSQAVLRSTVTVEGRYGPVTGLAITLPTSWRLLRVAGSEEHALTWDTVRQGEVNQIRVRFGPPVPQGKPTVFTVEAEHAVAFGEAGATIRLPTLTFPTAAATEGSLVVAADESLTARFQNLRNLEPTPLEVDPQQLVSSPRQRVLQSFRFLGSFSGEVAVSTRPPRLGARILLRAEPARDLVHVTGVVALDNQGGPLGEVRLLVPSPIASSLRIPAKGAVAERIREIVRAAPVRGRVPVSVRFESPLQGKLELPLAYSVPVSREGKADLPLPWVDDAERVESYVALVASPDVEVSTESTGLRAIPPILLPEHRLFSRSGRFVGSYSSTDPTGRLRLSLHRHEIAQVPDVYCPLIEIASTLAPDGSTEHAAVIHVRSAGRQYLKLQLPEEANLRAVLVNGEPIPVHRADSGLSIPLPPSNPLGPTVTVLYDTPAPPKGYLVRAEEVAPKVDAPVGEIDWTLEYEPAHDVVAVEGDVQLTKPLPPGGLIVGTLSSRPDLVVFLVALLMLGAFLAGSVALLALLFRQVKRWRLRLVTRVVALITIAGLAIGVGLACLGRPELAREASRYTQCRSHLKQIYLALEQYHRDHGRYPPAAIGPAGYPLDRQFSWVVALLPYLGRDDLYRQLDLSKPVDAPANAQVLQNRVTPSVLSCPSSPLPYGESLSYLAVLGGETIESSEGRGVFGLSKSLSRGEILDGADRTALIVETSRPVRWYVASEAAIAIRAPAQLSRIGGLHGGIRFLLADGRVIDIRQDAPLTLLQSLATATAGDGPLPGTLAENTARQPVRHLRLGLAPSRRRAGLEVEAEMALQVAEDQMRFAAPMETSPVAQAIEEPPASAEEHPSGGAERREQAATAPGAQQPQTAGPLAANRPAPFVARKGARLSLRLKPSLRGWPSLAFVSYDGTAAPRIVLRHRTMAWALAGLVAAIVWAAAWQLRCRWSLAAQVAVAVLLGPVAASAALAMPPSVAPAADGVALGSLAWLLSLLARGLAAFRKRRLQANAEAGSKAALTTLLLTATALLSISAPMAKADEPPEQGPIVVVPYDPAVGVPTPPVGMVYVPEPTLRLLGIEERGPDLPDRFPLGSVVRFDVQGRLDGNEAAFDVVAAIRCLIDGPTLVLLPIRPVPVVSASLDGADFASFHQVGVRESTRPIKGGKGAGKGDEVQRLAVVVKGKGLHRLELSFRLPIEGTAQAGSVRVPVVRCPAGELRFRLPDGELRVETSGLRSGYEVDEPSGAGRGYLVAALGQAQDVEISWRPVPKVRAQATVAVEQHTLIDVQESGIYLRSRLRYEVHNSSFETVRLNLPPGIAVLQIEGADVATWEILASEEQPVLEIRLKKRVDYPVEFRVDMLDASAAPEGRYRVRLPQAPQAARQTGVIAIGCGTQFRIFVDQRGMNQISRDLAKVPEPHQPDFCAVLGAYRYTGTDWEMTLQISRYRTRWESRAATVLEIGEAEWRVGSVVGIGVSDGPLAEFRLDVPRGLRLRELDLNRPAEWLFDRNRGVLSVHLHEPTAEPVQIRIAGTLVPETIEGEHELVLPFVEGAERQRSELAVVTSPQLGLHVSFPGARAIPPDALTSARLRAYRSRIKYAALHQGRRPAITLNVQRVRPRVQAVVAIMAVVGEDWLEYMGQLRLQVESGALDRISFLVPAVSGRALEITGADIAQRTSEPVNEATVRWTVDFARPLTGDATLYVWQRVPRVAAQATLPWLKIEGVERQDHFVGVAAGPRIVLERLASTGLDETRTTYLPAGIDRTLFADATWIFRAVNLPYALTVKRIVTETSALPEVEVFLAHHRTLVDVSGSYRAELELLLRNSTRQYLKVRLPEGARLLGARLDGTPVAVSRTGRNDRELLLPLAQTPLADVAQSLVVVFEGTLGEPLSLRRTWALPAAEVADDVPIAYTLWTVLAPKGTYIREWKTNMDPVERDDVRIIRQLAVSDAMVRAWQAAARWAGAKESHKVVETIARELNRLKESAGAAYNRSALPYQEKLQSNLSLVERELSQFQAKRQAAAKLADRFQELQTQLEQQATQANQPQARQQAEQKGGRVEALRRQSLLELGRNRRKDLPHRKGGQKQGRPVSSRRGGPQQPRAEVASQARQTQRPGQLPQARLGTVLRLPDTGNAVHFFKTKGSPRLVIAVWQGNRLKRWRQTGAVLAGSVGIGALLAAVVLIAAKLATDRKRGAA